MKTSALAIIRWILLFLSPLLIIILAYLIENEESMGVTENFLYASIIIVLWFFITVALLSVFIYKRTTISRNIKNFLIVFILVSLIVYLVFRIFASSINVSIGAYIVLGFGYSLVYSIILSFICYLEKIEIILLGLIPVIIIGFIINRFGISEGEFIIPFAFFLSSVGFILLVFRSIPVLKTDKTKGIIFVLFYSVIAILNALFLIKFMAASPALNSFSDPIGVVIFLLACLSLFIILPFSNYTDWPKFQKLSFKRLIITPLILFLFIFSLKFLLPDKIYKNIFFKEYSQKEIIHFNMEDYVIDFSGK